MSCVENSNTNGPRPQWAFNTDTNPLSTSGFGYDRYANLTAISSTQCSAPVLSLSVNTNNQITNSGFSYDAAGDLTGDGVNTYSWNAEAHLKSAAGVTYTYDGDLRRVEKSSGTLYWYCASCGKVLAESDSSGNLTSEYTFFGGQRIARRDVSSGNIYYIFSDRLGSYRTLTDANGNVKGESDYYPFGAERVISSTVTDNFRFAGMEWDSEGGLNHTLYRQYTPAQCRWESTDPVRGCVMHPQGQNLYAYVRDNPTNLTDPNGDIAAACDPITDPDCCDPPESPFCFPIPIPPPPPPPPPGTCQPKRWPQGFYPPEAAWLGDLCVKENKKWVEMWAFTCDPRNDRTGCCDLAEDAASKQCESEGRQKGELYSLQQYNGLGGTYYYANCCDTGGRFPPPPPPPKPKPPKPRPKPGG